MKRLASLFAVTALAVSIGCTPQQEPNDAPPPPKTPAAESEPAGQIVQDYGEGLVRSMDKARSAQAKVDIREVQRAIQEYALSHDGAYPPTLDDITGDLNGDIDLSQFKYNPDNGAVSIKGG